MGEHRKPIWRGTIIAMLMALATGPAAARDVTGALAYRERIALPPDAVLIVEAADGLGRPLATLRQPTRRRAGAA